MADATSTPTDGATPDGPAIRVHGAASPEEVAAVVAVLLAAGGGDEGSGSERRPGSTWASHRSLLRGRHDPGPGAWRSTFRP